VRGAEDPLHQVDVAALALEPDDVFVQHGELLVRFL
jgi:hypothetical protein